MTGNLTPWLVLLGAVVASLAWKGYVKLPNFLARGIPTPAADAAKGATGLSSHELGLLFALATRREAEEELARAAARQAGETIKVTFSAPFAPPSGETSPPPGGGQ
jgi:hypothetical protein